MIIYHNPRCSKSRETLKMIQDKGINVQVVEYLKQPLPTNELEAILKKLGMKAEDIVRKNETLYKEQYKGRKINEAEWLKILSENPVLIERPIVIKGNKAVLGRPPENVSVLF